MNFVEAKDPITGAVLDDQVVMVGAGGVVWSIPLNGGWLYQQYMDWLAAGNTLQPAS